MKIVQTEEDVLKVYPDDGHIWLEFEERAYAFTYAEVQTLIKTLDSLVGSPKFEKED